MTDLRALLLKIFDEKFNKNVDVEYINGDETKFSACINGLKSNSYPNCNILDSFKSKSCESFFLVDVNGFVMELRLSKASSDSNYEAYCVVNFSEKTSDAFYRKKEFSK